MLFNECLNLFPIHFHDLHLFLLPQSNVVESTKHYLHYEVPSNTLIPLDKRLVYLSMIFSWMFWITAFYTYYRWAVNGNKGGGFVLTVPKDGENPQVVTAKT